MNKKSRGLFGCPIINVSGGRKFTTYRCVRILEQSMDKPDPWKSKGTCRMARRRLFPPALDSVPEFPFGLPTTPVRQTPILTTLTLTQPFPSLHHPSAAHWMYDFYTGCLCHPIISPSLRTRQNLSVSFSISFHLGKHITPMARPAICQNLREKKSIFLSDEMIKIHTAIKDEC